MYDFNMLHLFMVSLNKSTHEQVNAPFLLPFDLFTWTTCSRKQLNAEQVVVPQCGLSIGLTLEKLFISWPHVVNLGPARSLLDNKPSILHCTFNQACSVVQGNGTLFV